MADVPMAIPWGIVLIVLPLAAAMVAFVWPRVAQMLALFCSLAIALAVVGLALQLWRHGVFQQAVGGWAAPLGIGLYADGACCC